MDRGKIRKIPTSCKYLEAENWKYFTFSCSVLYLWIYKYWTFLKFDL